MIVGADSARPVALRGLAQRQGAPAGPPEPG